MSEEFPRSMRITQRSEFQRLMTEGKRVRTGDLDVRYLASPLGYVRVGIIVPLYGHTAVQRNKLKRRLRELVRRTIQSTTTSVDVVIQCRPDAYGCSFAELRSAIESMEVMVTEPGDRRDRV